MPTNPYAQYTQDDVDRLNRVIIDLINQLPKDGNNNQPGRSVLLRTNGNVVEWQREGDAGWVTLFTVPPVTEPVRYLDRINAKLTLAA